MADGKELEPPAASVAKAPTVAELDPEPLETLRALERNGSSGLVDRTIDKFIGYGDGLLRQMAASIDQGDAAELARAAHSLKSSSANLGARALSEQCRELETLICGGCMPENIAQRLNLLRTTYAAVTRALESERPPVSCG